MVTTKSLDASKLKKPIIMPKNPARGHMPYELARADDLAARERQEKLAELENELLEKNKEELQKKADEMIVKQQAKKEEPEVEVPQDDVVESVVEASQPKAKGKKKTNPFEK